MEATARLAQLLEVVEVWWQLLAPIRVVGRLCERERARERARVYNIIAMKPPSIKRSSTERIGGRRDQPRSIIGIIGISASVAAVRASLGNRSAPYRP